MQRTATTIAERVATVDWPAVAGDVDAYGCALTSRILDLDECRGIAGLYDQAGRFRATIDMERYRFGSGQYRYFARPLPDPVAQASPVRHGVSVVRSGERHTLGLVFHDAA